MRESECGKRVGRQLEPVDRDRWKLRDPSGEHPDGEYQDRAAHAAERGHAVTLYEKAAELGGQFNLAKRIPGKQEFGESIAYFSDRLRRAGVSIRLNNAPRTEDLRSYDEVVIATGIDPRRPAIPGIEHKKVVGYVEVLSGRVEPGREVVIIGMGGIGFDVALYLLERGSRAPLDPEAFAHHWGVAKNGDLAAAPAARPKQHITMMKRSHTPFGHTLGRTTGWVHRAELARNGVRMLKGVEYRGIDDQGVHISVDGKDMTVAADTVIVCAGQEPRRELAGHHIIGGAKEASELDAKRAMLEGAELAAAL
jgi:2,4-dienoyl-CoA reductase (NADPH2)